MIQVFERHSESNAYKDGGVGQLLLSRTDALRKENEKLGAVYEQLKPKCESKRTSLGT